MLCVALLPLNYGAYAVFGTPAFVLLAESSVGDWHLAGLRIVTAAFVARSRCADRSYKVPYYDRSLDYLLAKWYKPATGAPYCCACASRARHFASGDGVLPNTTWK